MTRRTTTEADAEQTAVGGSLEPKLDCGLYTNSGIQRAITNAYATMTSLTATATATRNQTTKVTKTSKEDKTVRNICVYF